MTESGDNISILTLSEANALVKDVVEYSMPDEYWVQAEIANINDSRGHCYMELVEMKTSMNGLRTPVAQARACCWSNTWASVARKFASATGDVMRRGMKVLLCVQANFHVAYGFSWIVSDVDPTYTMGDMARRRKEIIEKLKAQGVFDNNKTLQISPFMKRIAVISSATAAGYGDFCNQLSDNAYGFAFHTQLFPAVMQGEQVEQSIIDALDTINGMLMADHAAFDAVVIIRGGGSTSDLSGFDTFGLAENVANFPLPVITGIGHERDQSILDLVACRSMKTPTAVAAFLIDNLAETLSMIDACAVRIATCVKGKMERERMGISNVEHALHSALQVRILRERSRLDVVTNDISATVGKRLTTISQKLDAFAMKMPLMVNAIMQRERHRVEMFGQRVAAVDPVNILRKGYSIAMFQGNVVTDARQLRKGDEVTLILANGKKKVQVS